MKKTYDALVIPTGETTFGDKSFPVTNTAIELFKKGDIGNIFITGGHGGFAKVMPPFSLTEAKETLDYILKKGIPSEKVFYDDRSLDSIGNFTYPLVSPQIHHSKKELKVNPNLKDFEKIMIIGQEGHIWRIMDYVNLVMPFSKEKVRYYTIPGKHNNGRIAKTYHKAILNAINKKHGETPSTEKVHEFLIKEHPFYSHDWYHKSVFRREIEMSKKILEWMVK